MLLVIVHTTMSCDGISGGRTSRYLMKLLRYTITNNHNHHNTLTDSPANKNNDNNVVSRALCLELFISVPLIFLFSNCPIEINKHKQQRNGPSREGKGKEKQNGTDDKTLAGVAKFFVRAKRARFLQNE